MGLHLFCRLASICLGISVLSYCYLPAKTVFAVTQSSGWADFTPPDEEFTVSVPGNPIARIHPVHNPRDSSVEKLLAQREYSGYGSGLIFIIQSLKAEHPQRLSSSYLNFLQQGTDFERHVSVDGLDATEFRRTVTSPRGTYTKRNLRFVTGKHLYLITLATIEENNPAVDQFLTSLRWHRDDKAITPIQPPVETATGDVLNQTEIPQRALVFFKPLPSYTEDARAHKVRGTITLQVVFAANGYVTNITVTRELPRGLNESAIDAARGIRFFPAQKDGKPVSQRAMLEYNFNIY